MKMKMQFLTTARIAGFLPPLSPLSFPLYFSVTGAPAAAILTPLLLGTGLLWRGLSGSTTAKTVRLPVKHPINPDF